MLSWNSLEPKRCLSVEIFCSTSSPESSAWMRVASFGAEPSGTERACACVPATMDAIPMPNPSAIGWNRDVCLVCEQRFFMTKISFSGYSFSVDYVCPQYTKGYLRDTCGQAPRCPQQFLFLTLKFRSAAAGLCVGAAGLLRVGTAAVGSAGGRAGGHQQTVVVKSQAIVKVKPSEIFQFLRDLNGREVHSGCCRNCGAAFCRNGCVRTHADCH